MYNIDTVTKPKITNTSNNFLIQGSEHFHFLLVQIDRRDTTIVVWREKQEKERGEKVMIWLTTLTARSHYKGWCQFFHTFAWGIFRVK